MLVADRGNDSADGNRAGGELCGGESRGGSTVIDLEQECADYVALYGGDNPSRIKAAFEYGVSCGRLRESQEAVVDFDHKMQLLHRAQEECQ